MNSHQIQAAACHMYITKLCKLEVVLITEGERSEFTNNTVGKGLNKDQRYAPIMVTQILSFLVGK